MNIQIKTKLRFKLIKNHEVKSYAVMLSFYISDNIIQILKRFQILLFKSQTLFSKARHKMQFCKHYVILSINKIYLSLPMQMQNFVDYRENAEEKLPLVKRTLYPNPSRILYSYPFMLISLLSLEIIYTLTYK